MSEYKTTTGLTFKEAYEMCKKDQKAEMIREGWPSWYGERHLGGECLTTEDALADNYTVRTPIRTYTAAEALELPVGTVLEGCGGYVEVMINVGPTLVWRLPEGRHHPIGITAATLAGPWRIVEDPS